MIDRTKQPAINAIKNLRLPPISTDQLSNGVPVYSINMGTQDVVKIEIIFKAGRPFEEKRLVARATNSLIKEGSAKYPANVLAEELDFYGCTLSTPFSLDTSTVAVYCMNKHLPKVMPIIGEVLQGPAFSQRALDAYIRRSAQQLKIDLAKSDVLAYRQVTEHIFGESHPYGYNSFEDTYGALERADLQQHYERAYRSNNCQVVMSGKISSMHLELLDQCLGHFQEGAVPMQALPIPKETPRKIKMEHPNAVQSAIRIGRRLFNRHHPDYLPMYVLNTILGGYFSSRLMTNIREDKGYTYNVYSSLDGMLFDGYFFIGTETSNDLATAAKAEIYKEIRRLQEELVGKEELEMVRNYLIGTFLTMLDGPFNVAETVKTIMLEDLAISFFDDLIRTVQEIQPERIQQLAQQYLKEEELWEVVVG
ncbi:MAG: pitrilysin family protein [Bacteroidota bacterium]